MGMGLYDDDQEKDHDHDIQCKRKYKYVVQIIFLDSLLSELVVCFSALCFSLVWQAYSLWEIKL